MKRNIENGYRMSFGLIDVALGTTRVIDVYAVGSGDRMKYYYKHDGILDKWYETYKTMEELRNGCVEDFDCGGRSIFRFTDTWIEAC